MNFSSPLHSSANETVPSPFLSNSSKSSTTLGRISSWGLCMRCCCGLSCCRCCAGSCSPAATAPEAEASCWAYVNSAANRSCLCGGALLLGDGCSAGPASWLSSRCTASARGSSAASAILQQAALCARQGSGQRETTYLAVECSASSAQLQSMLLVQHCCNCDVLSNQHCNAHGPCIVQAKREQHCLVSCQ